jgi:hypothetical protein
LRQICGLPEPVEAPLYGSAEGLSDEYHGLLIGPCEPHEVEAEQGFRLVEPMSMALSSDDRDIRDNFDCSYEEWIALFREDVRHASSLDPAELEPPVPLISGEQLAEADRARETGEDLPIDSGHRIFRRGTFWYIADVEGLLLASGDGNCWTVDDGEDEGVGPGVAEEGEVFTIRFDTPEAALAFVVRARARFEAMIRRQKIAFERLGRPLAQKYTTRRGLDRATGDGRT